MSTSTFMDNYLVVSFDLHNSSGDHQKISDSLKNLGFKGTADNEKIPYNTFIFKISSGGRRAVDVEEDVEAILKSYNNVKRKVIVAARDYSL